LVQFKHVDGLLKALKKAGESQFHFGSIQTHHYSLQLNETIGVSQFHFGSIQTGEFVEKALKLED